METTLFTRSAIRTPNYLPAHADVPALVPTLKPKEGNYKVNVMPLKMVHRELKKWKKIHSDLFR